MLRMTRSTERQRVRGCAARGDRHRTAHPPSREAPRRRGRGGLNAAGEGMHALVEECGAAVAVSEDPLCPFRGRASIVVAWDVV